VHTRSGIGARVALVVALIAIVFASLEGGSRAAALRMARPMRLELLRALPATLPPDGGLVVSPRVADRAGNVEPRAVRMVGPDGASVQLRVEELAPQLYRIAPARRLARGRYTVRGIGSGALAIRVSGAAGATFPAPDLDSVVRSRRSIGAAEVERVTVTLRSLPTEAVAIFARWPDWTDSEGGLYGAWTPLGDTASFALICTAEDRCGPGLGHIPRPRERGELRFVDAAGRVSQPTAPFVVE
jgi:hypothetical protein